MNKKTRLEIEPENDAEECRGHEEEKPLISDYNYYNVATALVSDRINVNYMKNRIGWMRRERTNHHHHHLSHQEDQHGKIHTFCKVRRSS